MHEILQKQIFTHYKLWYNNRTNKDLTDYNKVTCNRCRNKFNKEIMRTRIYGVQRKTFFYCPTCFSKLKNPK